MAEEPQPPNVKAGSTAADADGENPGLKAASKDDAKAAAALDKLDARGDDEPSGAGGASTADAAALAGAMSNLKVGAGDGSGDGKDGGSGGGSGPSAAAKAKAEEEARRKKIKVDPKDVALVVEHCELKKEKATDLLRAHDGDVRTALAAWVTGKA